MPARERERERTMTMCMFRFRMSSSASQQVRPVIECLCQILSSYGFSPVTPEVFRLAKFDRDEAVSVASALETFIECHRVI